MKARLDSEPNTNLESLEADSGWRHFPYAILAPAVLYAKQHPSNSRYQDPDMLALALQIGDLLAAEDEAGNYAPRLDSDWDTYMWLEAYRLLEEHLGESRKERWAKALERNVRLVLETARERIDFPWYNSPYIGTSPNHYALYAKNLLLAGVIFGYEDWKELGSQILHRFSTEEQTVDGYWGEHSRRGPTTGYNYLTLSAVALYWEYTKDPAALDALRKATDFHSYFTYPDGTPVEVINDRNRYWSVSPWGHFGFSHFKDGRGYAEFLTSFFEGDSLTMSELGRLAQNALYYHEGSSSVPPPLRPNYVREMEIPAGIRKSGPWVLALSGIIDTQAINSRFYLDRQGHMTLFHEKLGPIISGANSKRQPELATFTETLSNQIIHIPLSSRLQMEGVEDRLSLAYNTFWVDLLIPEPAEDRIQFRVSVTGRGRPAEDPLMNLQLVLQPGEVLVTGSGRRIVIGDEPFELSAQEVKGRLQHRGWTLDVDSRARLVWPFFPHNPYSDNPETSLDYAVGRLTIPLSLKSQPGRYIRPDDDLIEFAVSIDAE